MRFQRIIEPQDVSFLAIGVLVGSIAVVAMQAGCEADARVRSPALWTGSICPASATDLLSEELARCRNLRRDKADDPDCKALWASQRRRFIAPGKASESDRGPLDLFPTVPKAQELPAGPLAPAQKSE